VFFGCMLHVFYSDVCVWVAMVFNCVSGVFFKCFISMFQVFQLSSDVCCNRPIWMFQKQIWCCIYPPPTFCYIVSSGTVNASIRARDGRWARDEGAACVGRKWESFVRMDVASRAGWVLGGGGCVRHGLGARAQTRGDMGAAGWRSPIALMQSTWGGTEVASNRSYVRTQA
jgi:hypothetical protein